MEYRGLVNFRDMGGHRTSDGRIVASGNLFRSGRFEMLGRGDGDHLVRTLGVARLLDLRTAEERQMAGDLELVRRHRHVRVHHVPFVSKIGLPATGTTAVSSTPQPSHHDRPRPGSWEPAELSRRYLNMTIESGRFTLARIIDILTGPGGVPAAFHCWSGKDRTGVTAAMLLDVLGVSDDAIAKDYAATADWFAAHLSDHPELQSAPSIAAYEVVPETMQLTLQGLRAQFGSVEQMVIESGGRSDQIEALRNVLLAPA